MMSRKFIFFFVSFSIVNCTLNSFNVWFISVKSFTVYDKNVVYMSEIPDYSVFR
jgi:hypothetical protein